MAWRIHEAQPMTTAFNVTAAYDKQLYMQGEKITVAITGNATSSVTSQIQAGPLAIPIVAADGTKSTVSTPAVPITITSNTPQAVVIDTTRPIVDSSATPHTWAVSTDKKSITATA